MAGLLEDKVAVVTGGSSGNGRAICHAFAREGAAAVVVGDLQYQPREGGEPTHEIICSQTDSQAKFVECDVRRPDSLEEMVASADELGGVDVMVNNAGIFGSHDFLQVTEEDYDRMMDINVKGTCFGAQAAAKRMVEKGSGSIINLSSVAGLSGSYQSITYCTSRGAVRLLTYSLAAGLGTRGVRVNAIHPGVIETTMTTSDVPILGGESEEAYLSTVPMRRPGTTGEVANTAVYLASELSSYVNGESLVVDGGMTSTR